MPIYKHTEDRPFASDTHRIEREADKSTHTGSSSSSRPAPHESMKDEPHTLFHSALYNIDSYNAPDIHLCAHMHSHRTRCLLFCVVARRYYVRRLVVPTFGCMWKCDPYGYLAVRLSVVGGCSKVQVQTTKCFRIYKGCSVGCEYARDGWRKADVRVGARQHRVEQ